MFKSVHNQNPNFIKNISATKQNFIVQTYQLILRNRKSAVYGGKSLKMLNAKVWNVLPTNIKSEPSLIKFKKYVEL